MIILKTIRWRIFSPAVVGGFIFLVFFSAVGQSSWAVPTTADQARSIVRNWLSLNVSPLGAPLGTSVNLVDTYRDDKELPIYHVVYLDPSGLVIVSGDDLVEPIVAFVPGGTVYDPSPENPLGAMVEEDLSIRTKTVREMKTTSLIVKSAWLPKGPMVRAWQKWTWLQGFEDSFPEMLSDRGINSVSDERVSPLIQSKWGQGLAEGFYCYNFYTPNHSVCGDLATAMAQLMRYHQFPTTGVGVGGYTISVDGVPQVRNLRGGDGAGGPYEWTRMVMEPTGSTPTLDRQAIGTLTHDAGVSVNTSYTLSVSSADPLKAVNSFKTVFGYSNAMTGYKSAVDGIPISNLTNMINPNLDGGYPVLLYLTNNSGSNHAVVVDGYGYNVSTLYHHLNMGLSGTNDAWYNLPAIDTGSQTYTLVNAAVYNVFKTGTGEIISGRVVDENGNPVEAAVVTATITGVGSYSGITNSRGIYAILKVLSACDYTVRVEKSGYTFPSQSVSTGTSVDNSYLTGNVWGVDFDAFPRNDNFASAVSISGTSSGQTSGSNITATKESGEPNHAGNAGGKSVWWTWTAPSDGQMTLDTHGSSFDTLLAVYTGSNVSSLTQVAANDNDGSSNNNSGVRFLARPETSYKIAVDGADGMSGEIALNWSFLSGNKPVYDFNEDGKPDILYRHPSSGKIGVWLMNGTAESTWKYIGNHGTTWDIKGVGDFNSDDYNDILYKHSNGNIGVWLMNGITETTWQPITDKNGKQPANHDPWDINGVTDFNNDGHIDVLYRNPINGNIGVWLMDGTTELSWQAIGNHGTAWDIKGVGDFNNDNYSDILYRHSNGNIGVWLMNGTTEVTWKYIGNHGLTWDIKGIADYNTDGYVDVLYRNHSGNVGVWLMVGTTESTWKYIGNHGSWDIR